MKIYIAGKITGLPEVDVLANFGEAEKEIRARGHVALSPVTLFPPNPVWDWVDYMLADLSVIWRHADGVLLLANWVDSPGAGLEQHAARLRNITIFNSVNDIPLAQ